MWYFVSCVEQVGGDDSLNHVLQDVGAQLLVSDGLGVLGRDDDCIHTHRLVVRVVLDRHLALAVGTQVGHLAVLANLAQPLRQLVRQRDRCRHQFGGLVGRVTEHHALVACAAGINAHGDVAGLFVDGRDDRAGVRIETIERVIVANRRDRSTHQALKVHIGLCRDFAGYHHQPGAGQGLACYTAVGVLREAGVKNRVGNLVGDLIRMPFGDRLTCKQKTVAVSQNNSSRESENRRSRPWPEWRITLPFYLPDSSQQNAILERIRRSMTKASESTRSVFGSI